MKEFLCIMGILVFQITYAQEFPEEFDLRDYNGNNYVTPVKSQEGGTCWTHGAMAAIEGNLLMNGNWEAAGLTNPANLSEYHLDWWNGFNNEFNQDTMPDDGSGLDVHYGGDYRVTSAYLSRADGAVKDTTTELGWYYEAPQRRSDRYDYFYVRDIDWYTMEDGLNGINTIKAKIMEHGVMGTCMAYDYEFINDEYEHYQPESSDMLPNHAIAIIGWDDNRQTQAPEPGAWLCKNSWGTWWGNDGYFWISYYDKYAGRDPEMGAISMYNTVEPFFDTIYYHDYHGWRDTQEEISTAMNRFSAVDSITIKAVSFYTAVDSVNFTCTIYDDFDAGVLSNQLSEVSGFIEHTGFHTIDLIDSAEIPQDDDFYLELNLDKGGQPFDRTSEVPVLLCGNNKKTVVYSTASPGQSFYKDETGNWVDFYDEGDDFWQHSGNFCMKAIVDYGMTPSSSGIQNSMNQLPDVKVAPQPVKNKVTITLTGNYTALGNLLITTIDGKVVRSIDANGRSGIKADLSALPQGFYIYHLNTVKGKVSGKIIKQ